VRLVLDEDGGLSVTATPLPEAGPASFRFALAEARTSSENRFLFHKTTRRTFYDGTRAAMTEALGVAEAVFLNERGELTEGSFTTLFIERDGVLLTPALDCGLLPGTLRAELLASDRAREAVLFPRDLESAEAVWLGNSVRGLVRAEWVPA
jgi:para-aminobenzoate synthetase/4-amino-4-deoxychorismate lyase